MRTNIDSHSTPSGLSFNLDVSGFSGLTGLELPKRCCDPVLTLDYGRLPGDALALGPSELLDDTTRWDPFECSEVQQPEDKKKMISLVFYVIVIVKEYSGFSFFFFFLFLSLAVLGV